MLTLYCFSYWGTGYFDCFLHCHRTRAAYGLEGLGHDLRAVVDSEDNIGDTSSSKSFNLVLDHGLVGELDEWLGVGEGLQSRLALL